jgi:hypothetical protein
VADGRYLARNEAGGESGKSVLVVETLVSSPLPARRRRRARPAEESVDPPRLPLSRATAVRAEPFERREDAEAWLQATAESDEAAEELLAEGIGLLNRALFAQAAALADPHLRELTPESATTVRIGYGSGEEVAAGRYSEARHVDASVSGGSRRRRRSEELRPQERVAAVLGGRERIDACETLVLRARADLDAGRDREAALQLRVGLDALLIELAGALDDPGHAEDMATLDARRDEAGTAADAALRGDLDPAQLKNVADLTALCERVLRRRRVLRG